MVRKKNKLIGRTRRIGDTGSLHVNHSNGGSLSPTESGELVAAARSRIPLICLTTCSSVFHTSHSPIPILVASTSSLPVLFLYCISLSTKRPALKCISLSPTRRRIARRIWTVFGLIPEPGRIVIGSTGATRVGSEVDKEIEVDELTLE